MYRQTILRWKDLGHRGAVARELECLGFVAHAEDLLEQAVCLLGAAEVLRETCEDSMDDRERLEYDEHVVALRQALDTDTFNVNWLAGRAMNIGQAVSFAIGTSGTASRPEDNTIPQAVQPSPSRLIEPLSEREREVLRLLAEGLSNSEIAQRLFLALTTVKVHTRHIYEKLGVNSRNQAVVQGQKLKLL